MKFLNSLAFLFCEAAAVLFLFVKFFSNGFLTIEIDSKIEKKFMRVNLNFFVISNNQTQFIRYGSGKAGNFLDRSSVFYIDRLVFTK